MTAGIMPTKTALDLYKWPRCRSGIYKDLGDVYCMHYTSSHVLTYKYKLQA